MPREFRRTWTAHGPLDVLLEATEPARLPELHPLVTAVSDIAPDGAGVTWTIDERVPLAFLSIPNRYRARRERVGPHRLVLEAWSRPEVHLVHTLDLTEVPEGVRVEHTVRVEAPAWVLGFVDATARKAHDEWVRRVRTWVAAEGTRRACGGERLAPCTEPFRRGTMLVFGSRGGTPWEVLVSENGAGFVRFVGVAPSGAGGLELAPAPAFGRGGLSGDGFTPAPDGHRFAGWFVRGPRAALDALPEWVAASLLADAGGARTLVAGALVITASDPAGVIEALRGAG